MENENNLFVVLVEKQASCSIQIQLVVKRLQANLKQLGRLRLVIPSLVQCPQNHLPLDHFERTAHRKCDCVFGTNSLALVEWIRCEVMPLDLLSRANYHRAFDHISQFPHVSWPRMKAQCI